MTKVFTMRLNKELTEKLAQLAKSTHRSRAGVIRWLVSQASQEFLPEEITNLPNPSVDIKQDCNNAHTSLGEISKRKETTS